MVLSDVAVRRPVFAMVMAIMLVAFGILSFRELTVREYPDIVPPIVSVQTTYPGASAAVVETRITEVLESTVSGIEGIKSITSSSRDGMSFITVEFSLERDIDAATNDVRDRVSQAARRLPNDVELPIVSKRESDARPVMFINVASTTMNRLELGDYVDRYIMDRFATIPGVSQVNAFGGGRPAMRIWLNRDALAARGLAVTDIDSALRRENIELPAGKLESRDREFPVRLGGGYQSVADFERLVITRGGDGHLVRLGEVARVAEGPRDRRDAFRVNGQQAIGFGVVKQSNANTVDVVTAIVKEIERVQSTLPPGMSISKSSDDSVFIRAAINAVYVTIGITTVLVGLVILVFLGSLRAMLIPVITIPICLISAFTALAAMGYSINLITLLALVLSIGLVVDDAVVVLENIHRRIDEKGEAPLLAAFKGSRQVAFAVVATTVVIVAVFAPIAFLKDNVGLIFAELAVTICAAVVFSSLVALTLVPMMCSKLLRPHGQQGRVVLAIDRGFDRLGDWYVRALAGLSRAPWLMVALTAAIAMSLIWLFDAVPKEYSPAEDQGSFVVSVRGVEGTSFDRMNELAEQIEAPLMPYVASGDIQRALIRIPGWGSTTPSTAMGVVTLAPWNETSVSTDEVMRTGMAVWSDIPALRVVAFMRSGLSRGGGGQPVQLVLGGSNYDELAEWRDIILERAQENPNLSRLDSDLRETQPQVVVRIDRDRAADLGVSVETIGRTLQALMAEQRVTTFIRGGEEYDVVLQADDDQRTGIEDLANTYVRSTTSGELIPLANVVSAENIAGQSSLNRYDRLRAVTITASLADGYPLGDALAYLEQLVADTLPSTAQVGYKGESLEYKEASGSIYFSLGMALLVVFLVLAAQFENFIHPFVIMVCVPLAVAGGLIGLLVTGKTFNIYSQIGLVMLIGIAAKNGILIVEFINQMREAGHDFKESVLEGARIRLRPVLMTALSTIMGSVPLILATGPGSESRTTLGIVIFFGVAMATALTLFVIPVFYSLFARRTRHREAVSHELDALREKAAS